MLSEPSEQKHSCVSPTRHSRAKPAPGAKQIPRIKVTKKPFLINCARGALVDESALISALDTGQIKGAALDVLSDESPDLSASKLVGRDNVILTPHVAFYSDASIQDNRRISASNLHNFLDGTLENVRHFIV